jgi:vacuolar-type H+-ATPase subunit E/Vma4
MNMALPVILNEICAAGDVQIQEIEKDTQAQVDEIIACAQAQAQQIKEQARASASAPATTESARILYAARLEALKTVGKVREELVDAAFVRACEWFTSIHTNKRYPSILHRLVDEALRGLAVDEKARIFANPRDQAILETLKLDQPISYTLDCWGGLIVKSDDSRIVVINTFEARLERATALLRNRLTTFFEDGSLP